MDRFSAVAVAWLSLFIAACGGPSSAPDAGSRVDGGSACAGCIDGTGACVPGDSNDACGGGGTACSACTAGSTCGDGECVAPPACSPDSCDGCCRDGACLPGNADDACGAGGLGCQDCTPTGAACDSSGSCALPCGPDTCYGCCDASGACVEGVTDSTCGAFGTACTACDSTQYCESTVFDGTEPIGGECADLDCSVSCDGCCSGATCLPGTDASACGMGGASCVTCGTGASCSAGTCAIDPASRWDVLIVSGQIPATGSDGAAWDPFGGLPDPYVTVTVTDPDTAVDTSAHTTTKTDAVSAVWNEVVLSDVPARSILEQLSFAIADEDFDAPDSIDSCSVLATFDMDASVMCGSVRLVYHLRPH